MFICTLAGFGLSAQEEESTAEAKEPVQSLLCINEISPVNDLYEDEYGETDDWIELYNGGDQPIYLDDLYFTDDFTDPLKWKLVGPYFLEPGGHFILWMDGEVEQGALHASFKLKSEGERIAMAELAGDQVVWLDSATFGEVPPGTTFGRATDGVGKFTLLGYPTPRTSNHSAGLYLPPPRIDPAGSIFEGLREVTLRAPDSLSVVRFSTDGSEPDESSFIYTGPFFIDRSMQVNARAFREGFTGATAREAYILKPAGALPVLSLELPFRDLFDDLQGIYVEGSNGITGYCVAYEANWNRDWERRGRISMFEADGSLAFRNLAGIKIGGGCSRGLNMKGFNLFFRENYGEPFIDYPLFPGNEITLYHRIKIRNGGDDYQSMMFRDGLNQMLLRGKLDLDLMDYRPSLLYLNGSFWGIYGIREHFNEDYLRSHHGPLGEVDLIKSPFSPWSEIKSGSDSLFRQLYNFIETNDLSIPENYDYVAGEIDLNEYINYHIAEIYLANYDWPAINNAIWRVREGGKWRWMLFDTDGSTNFETYFETYPSYNSMEHATVPFGDDWPNSVPSTLFLRKLLENTEFRNEFVQRTCTVMELLFEPGRVARFTDSIAGLLDPHVDRHLDLWGENIPELGWGRSMGGSREAWEDGISHYKSFFEERPPFMLQHLESYFGLDGTCRLSLDTRPESHGRIHIHGNQMQLPYHYSGTYLKGIPIRLSAIPDEGYSFYKWKESGDPNPDIRYAPAGEATLTPLFLPAVSRPGTLQPVARIYPNPSEGMFHLEYQAGPRGLIRVAVFNAYGQVVENFTFQTNPGPTTRTIDLSGFQNGIYYLHMVSEGRESVEKIILMR